MEVPHANDGIMIAGAAARGIPIKPRQSPWRRDFQVDGGVTRPYFSCRRDPHMKTLAVVPVVLACAIGCGFMTASAAPSPSDIGVFVQADTSCPPANFALFGACVTILSTNPIVCGRPLVGYTMLSRSMMRKLDEAGNFVSLRGATVEEEACGQPLYEFKEFKRGIFPPCPLPQECGG